MNTTTIYQPEKYFFITFAITWVSWSVAAFLSYRFAGSAAFILFLIPGMVAPFGVALWMILRSKSADLKNKFRNDLFNLRKINPVTFLPMLLLMPAVLLVSTLISFAFGQPVSQLQFAGEFSFSGGAAPVLIILILAAAFEELGWRGYAFDSLGEKSNFFITTLKFSALWAAWHLPLFFVNGYYHNEIVLQNPLFGLNFLVSVVPVAFIITWLWKLNRNSIPLVILFHFYINLCQEALQVTQASKCIETGVLVLAAAAIVALNRKMFFQKPAELSHD